jgi:hypothetical protein
VGDAFGLAERDKVRGQTGPNAQEDQNRPDNSPQKGRSEPLFQSGNVCRQCSPEGVVLRGRIFAQFLSQLRKLAGEFAFQVGEPRLDIGLSGPQ